MAFASCSAAPRGEPSARLASSADSCSGVGPGPNALDVTDVPLGATGVRLCDSPAFGYPAAPPPSDALAGDAAAALAKLYNGLPEAPWSGACTADLGPRFTLIFSYGDRAPVVAMDAFGSTRLFRVADHALVWDEESKPGEWHRLVWTPNATHWAAIETAVAQGRAASGPPSRCPPSGATYDIALLASRSGLVAASRCLRAASGAVAEHPLNDKVGLLAGELPSGQAPALPCPTRLQPLRDDIIVRTADGTLAALVGTCGGVYVGNGSYWQLTTESSAWLAGLPPR